MNKVALALIAMHVHTSCIFGTPPHCKKYAKLGTPCVLVGVLGVLVVLLFLVGVLGVLIGALKTSGFCFNTNSELTLNEALYFRVHYANKYAFLKKYTIDGCDSCGSYDCMPNK